MIWRMDDLVRLLGETEGVLRHALEIDCEAELARARMVERHDAEDPHVDLGGEG